MNRMIKPLFAVLMLLGSAGLPAHPLLPGEQREGPLLLRGGVIHTISGATLDNADVLIVDGRIQAVGSELELPEGGEVLELEGRHVYPGLIALDTTLGLVEISAVRATRDFAEVGDFSPEVQAHVAFNTDSELIPVVRANGITHAQSVPQSGLVSGRSSLMHLDGWHWEDALVSADNGLHLRWPRIAAPQPFFGMGGSGDGLAERAERQRREIDQYLKRARGYHQQRESDESTRRDESLEAMRGVFAGDTRLFIHADELRQIEQALRLARAHGLDFTLVGGRDAWRVAEQLAEAGVDVIYNASFGMPIRTDDGYDQAFVAPKLLADAGVRVALAYTGSWDIRNLPFAAGYLVTHGLERDQALAMITRHPASILGLEQELGAIEPGLSASLVITSGDLLDYRGHPVEAMFIDGRFVDLDNRQRALYRKYGQRIDAASGD